MAELLLVNPRRRRKARKTRSRGRRRMSALQRKYFGGGRKRRRSRTRAVAAPRRRRRRAAARLSNPRRRRRRSLTRSFRRRRRNPSLRGGVSGVLNSVRPTLKAGFIGATGAIGLDLLWGYTSKYLPAQIAGSALAQYGAKLLGAIVVGMIGDKLPFLRGKGRDLANGAATVVLHDALKAQLQASIPSLQLGEYLTYAPTVGSMRQAGRLLSTGMGEYLSGLPQDNGYPADSSGYYGDGDGSFTGDGMSGF